jgi:hypothetical protein
MRGVQRAVCGGLAATLLTIAGCGGPKDKLYNVSGTVKCDGKPVPLGLVYFDPDATKGGIGEQGFANIKEGNFTTAVDGKGVRGGPYQVRVLGYDGRTANELPFGNPLFDEYQTTRELPRADTELSFEIPAKRRK